MADAAEFLIKITTQAAGLAATTGALQQLEVSIKTAQKSAEALTPALKKAGDAGKSASDGAAKAAKGSKDLSEAFGESALEATNTSGAVGKLQGILQKVGPEGTAAAAVIGVYTIALTALFGVIAAGMAVAIEATEKLGRLRSVLDALGGGAAGGGKALAIVKDLANALPFSTDQIGTWAKALMSAGFAGKDLKSAIEAVAAATAIMGEEGGAAAEKMLKQLKEGGKAAETMIKTVQQGGAKSARLLSEMGISTNDLAKALGKTPEQFKKMKLSAEELQKAIEKALQQKGKGPLESMALTFPVMLAKLKEGFMSLFEKLGPAVEPFMKAIKSLFGQFGKGTPIMKALGKIVTEVFGTIFKWATKAVAAISAFIAKNATAKSIGGAWAWVKDKIAALVPLVSALAKVWETLKAVLKPFGGVIAAIFKNATVLSGLKSIFKMIATMVGMIIITFAVLAAVWAVVVAAIAAGVALVIGFFAGLVGKVKSVVLRIIGAFQALRSFSLASAASNLVAGFVNGIKAKVAAVVAQAKAMGLAAVNALKSVLGIASPSRVMMQAGANTGEGFVQGVDKTQDKAAAAVGGLGSARPSAKGGSKGGGGVTFNNCVFGSVSKEQIRIWVTEILDEEAGMSPEMEPAT